MSLLPKIEDDSTPVSEDSTEEITEQGIQLAQLREEHEKDVALLHQTETELSEVKQQIEFEKTRIPRDQEVLHLLNVRKSRLISALPPIRRRIHIQEVEIPRLEHVLHLDRTREQRFAAAQVRAILTHDELPAFLDQLRGL